MNDQINTSNSSPDGFTNDQFWPLLDRYLAGECSPAEFDEVEQLISQNASVSAALTDLMSIREVVSTKSSWDSEALLDDLHCAIGMPSDYQSSPVESDNSSMELRPSSSSSRASSLPTNKWVHINWIAALTVVLAVGIFAIERNVDSENVSGDSTIVSTGLGQRAATQLPDGSRITLAPGSTLRYGGAYNKESREVILDGEAYFDVVTDANKPFIILAGSSRTQVLGTTFSVRRYTTDSLVKIVVATGRVAVGNKILSRGEIAQIAEDGNIQITHTKNPNLLLGWINDTLAFERTSAGEMLKTLGRWYGVEFVLNSPELLERRYSGKFAGSSLEDAVRLISTLMAVQPIYEGNKIVLK